MAEHTLSQATYELRAYPRTLVLGISLQRLQREVVRWPRIECLKACNNQRDASALVLLNRRK
jgi:hypothetical protein